MNLYQQEQSENRRWSFAALLTTALSLLALVALLSSCTTFEKAFRKYANNKVDTTFVTVSQTVPHDSAVLHLVTDTTTVYKEVRQGRARIIYQRDGRTTLVKANCDSVVVEKKVPQYITRQMWGVDPKFKSDADRWRTIAFVLMGLIGTAVIAYVFTYHLKLDVSQRNGTHPA